MVELHEAINTISPYDLHLLRSGGEAGDQAPNSSGHNFPHRDGREHIFSDADRGGVVILGRQRIVVIFGGRLAFTSVEQILIKN